MADELVPPRVGRYRNPAGELAERGRDDSRLIDPRRSSKAPGRINLRAVAEVLADRGYDPTVEIIDILAPLDAETGEKLPSKLEPEVQARMWNELLQYTQPKLKSVEVKAKVVAAGFDVNDEQAAKIAQEFLKQATGEAGE